MKKNDLRQQAEAKLGKRKKSPATETDTLRLIHELEVHQIELEMQNEQLIQARTEAEDIHRQYVDLYDFAPIGYFTLTRDGTILMSNLTGASLLGVERNKLVKRRFGVFVSVESRPAFSEFLEKKFSNNGNKVCEITLLKDGTDPLWVRLDAVCSEDRSECRVVMKNITERKQADEEILQLNANLEQRVEERTRELQDAQEQLVIKEKLAVLGQLAGGVGHELRNPLGVINSAVYYLKLVQPEANDKVREYHVMIEQEVHNAEKIISDLLGFARVISADREPVSVSDLIHQTLERFPAPPNVKVTLDIPADIPKIYADPRQITQVLGNLVLNACQAMKDGGQLLILSRIEGSVISDQVSADGVPRVRIAVKDTGVGVSPENMKKIFEPLFTTKAKGIGLGLAVSQKLIEANGGKIEVESEPGVGSTFTVWLPVK